MLEVSKASKVFRPRILVQYVGPILVSDNAGSDYRLRGSGSCGVFRKMPSAFTDISGELHVASSTESGTSTGAGKYGECKT